MMYSSVVENAELNWQCLAVSLITCYKRVRTRTTELEPSVYITIVPQPTNIHTTTNN